jgi:glycine/D-amino acid oxidase-like deaminating enzyme/nitrite reductase/ring-hydroxylating ferredoxin subunit
MKKTVLWKADTHPINFGTLPGDIDVDVAIIGGGITGITAGYLLAKAGKKVAVLEAWSVDGGTTGYSTGNLYAPVDEMLHKIESKYNTETIQAVAASRTAAMQQISGWIAEFDIDCNYQPTSWYLFSETPEDDETIEKEYEACLRAGLDAHKTTASKLPFPASLTLEVKNQAQFNPVMYMQAFAVKAKATGCQIYDNTKVLEVEEGDESHTLTTSHGKVTARSIIHATHTPKGVMQYHTLLGPYREYALAVQLNSGAYPDGTFWAFNKPHHHSMRTYTDEHGESHLLILGEPHKVGQKENNEECFEKLETYIRERFDVREITHRWGAQHYKSADTLPYIGRKSKGSEIYIATGYSTDGLTYGTLAGMLLTDQILGKENTWSEIYDPLRFNPLKSAASFIKENANVAAQYMHNLTFNPEIEALSEISNNEAKTIIIAGEKYGAYRDQLGMIHVVSAVCTHMKCIVNWNQGEKTWDCPCHGSRFNYDGKVIEGCAYRDLPTLSEQQGEDITKQKH